jgi:putative holliday junction resolvase
VGGGAYNQGGLYLCSLMGRIMGIDYGLKRTGISVTDPNQIIVQGLDTQETHSVLAFIVKYAIQEKLDEIVVGYPFVEGPWGDKRFKARLDEFIAALRKAFPAIPVTLHDERNTSVHAKEIISQSGKRKSKREEKGLLDRTSAILILQEYLGHI